MNIESNKTKSSISVCQKLIQYLVRKNALSKSSDIYKENAKIIPAKFPAQFLPFGLENFDVLDAQNCIDICKT